MVRGTTTHSPIARTVKEHARELQAIPKIVPTVSEASLGCELERSHQPWVKNQ